MIDNSGKAPPRREWIASTPSYLKALTIRAEDLPDNDKLKANDGAHLIAVLAGQDKAYWIITDGILDGVALNSNIRFVYKAHWQLSPTLIDQDSSWPDVEPSGDAHERMVETILFYGQSNAGAGGRETPALTKSLHPDILFSFASRRQLYGQDEVKPGELSGLRPLYDHHAYSPMQATAMGFPLASKHSPNMSNYLRYFMFTVWFGGQPLSAFEKDSVPWRNLMTAARSSTTEISKTGFRNVIRAIVFVHGEAGPWNRRTYGLNLASLLDELLPAIQFEAGQAQTPLAILLQINKGSRDSRPATQVELAQWDVTKRHPVLVLAGPSYQTPVLDNIHPTMSGRMLLGELLALVYDFKIRRGIDFNPLQPISAAIEGRFIKIQFRLPPEGDALSWDTAWVAPSEHFGFAYTDDMNSSTIESVVLSGPTEILVTLKNKPQSSAMKIAYAQGQSLRPGWPSGRGQLVSATKTRSYFNDLGYPVPPFVVHYCIRFELDVPYT